MLEVAQTFFDWSLSLSSAFVIDRIMKSCLLIFSATECLLLLMSYLTAFKSGVASWNEPSTLSESYRCPWTRSWVFDEVMMISVLHKWCEYGCRRMYLGFCWKSTSKTALLHAAWAVEKPSAHLTVGTQQPAPKMSETIRKNWKTNWLKQYNGATPSFIEHMIQLKGCRWWRCCWLTKRINGSLTVALSMLRLCRPTVIFPCMPRIPLEVGIIIAAGCIV